MVWLVGGLPALAVIASFVTYLIAAHNPDTLVNAGYHKEGLAPIKDTSKEMQAAALHVAGELELVNGMASIKLTGHLDPAPSTLELLLLHPTHSNQDQRILLAGRGDGYYSAPMLEGNAGKRQWILEPEDRAWRLSGELMLPLVGPIRLASDSVLNPP